MPNQKVNEINDWLHKNCGQRANGFPFFRVVWSTDQKENRHGTFNEHYNGIFLRTITKTKLVPKYTIFIDRWVMERYVSPEYCSDPSLIDAQQEGYYEPVYIFADKDRNYLEPDLDVVQAIYYYLTHPLERGEIKANMDKEIMLEEKKFDDAIQGVFDEESILADKLKFGEAVFISDALAKEK